jgi:tetratricopeptide (TPR) repeat protein
MYSGARLCIPTGSQSVIFEIQIDRNISEVKPFARISRLSVLAGEEEVLFCPGCVFRIESVQYNYTECFWHIKLISSNDVQQNLKDILYQFENDLGGAVNYITFGNALSKLNKLDEAKKYYTMLLNTLLSTHSTHTDLAQTHNNLGILYSTSREYELALSHFKMAEEIVNSNDKKLSISVNELANNIPDNQNTLILPDLDRYSTVVSQSQIHCNIGRVHQSTNNHKMALQYFEEARDLMLNSENESLNIASVYSHIGSVYYDQGDFSMARNNFEKALNITLKLLPPNHPLITASLNNVKFSRQRNSTNDTLISTEKQLQTLSTEDTTNASSS